MCASSPQSTGIIELGYRSIRKFFLEHPMATYAGALAYRGLDSGSSPSCSSWSCCLARSASPICSTRLWTRPKRDHPSTFPGNSNLPYGSRVSRASGEYCG